MSAVPQSSRFDFRISRANKSLIERAADAEGQTVSSFAIAALVRAAEESLQRSTVRTLSDRDARIFVKMLESQAEPNAAMKAAAKRYKERRGR